MRRLPGVILICLIFGVLWIPMSVGSEDTAIPAASPVASPVDQHPLVGVFAEPAAEVLLPPTATPGIITETLRLKRVELGPGTQLSPHTHSGAFALFVESGSICYTYTEPIQNSPQVIAKPASDEAAPANCVENVAPEQCDENGCTLNPGNTIYLPTWSSLTQSEKTVHAFWNPHGTRSAIVFLAELRKGTSEAPCGGSCH